MSMTRVALAALVALGLTGAAAAQSIESELKDPASPLEDLEETNRFINEDTPEKSDRWNPNIFEQVLPGAFGATDPGRADTAVNFGGTEVESFFAN